MSCRVLKRDMELAMLDRLVEEALAHGLTELIGYYFPTPKNGMVKDLFQSFGFKKISVDDAGNTVWQLGLEGYQKKNFVIGVI
jgi:predicted enzyme involved in methoxymalonyl-ACP biosynthesis